jgi:hypothetical protein
VTTLGGLLPGIPGSSCPAAATALAGIGVGPACQLASGISSVAGSAVSSVAGFGVDSVLDALGTWVADGASWLLGQIGSVIGSTTEVDLGASWFAAHYQTMAVLAGVVIVPLMVLGIIQSIYRQNASMLVRSTIVNVPLAILLTVVAVKLVQLGLAVTDAMSSEVAQGTGLDSGQFMTAVSSQLSAGQGAVSTAAPTFILFVGALAVVVGAVMVWVELLIRAAAVYVAVLFLPLALASLAWPAISHWTRRLVDTLVALILGKFVIVSVLSLAAGALTASSSGTGSFSAVLGGAALLLLAALAPWALFRLLPFLEAGAAGHLEGLSHRARQSAAAPARSLAHVAMQATAARAIAGSASSALGGAARSALGSASRGAAAGPGAGPGGHDAGGSRPEQAASSAESTGVGTMEPPAHDIPAWEVHHEATAAARQHYEDVDEPPPGSGALTPLPRETAARHHNALGRDQLGVRLVTTPIEGTAAPAKPALPRGGQGDG